MPRLSLDIAYLGLTAGVYGLRLSRRGGTSDALFHLPHENQDARCSFRRRGDECASVGCRVGELRQTAGRIEVLGVFEAAQVRVMGMKVA